MPTYETELKLAREAALAAGARLAEMSRNTIDVISAHGRDIKLQADRDAEAIIIETLTGGSDHPILAEESGEHGAPEGRPFWVIDPLDGTFNFSRGVPFCAVSIALVENERPLLGVIYDFNRDELLSGAPGLGATLRRADGEQPISVSGVREVGQAGLLTGFPVNRDFSDAALLEFIHEIQPFKKVRLIGSAAMATSWVAMGRLDAYAEADIMLWDVAAGLALIEAAGGWIDLRPSAKLKWARHVRAAAHADLWAHTRQD